MGQHLKIYLTYYHIFFHQSHSYFPLLSHHCPSLSVKPKTVSIHGFLHVYHTGIGNLYIIDIEVMCRCGSRSTVTGINIKVHVLGAGRHFEGNQVFAPGYNRCYQ